LSCDDWPDAMTFGRHRHASRPRSGGHADPDRAEAATPRQLATLVYGHRRIAQRRLLHLWQAGLLERAIVPHAQRGGAELAYRLSDRARRRLGDVATRSRGSNRLSHTLDIIETI